jgi:hypothetical protein
MRSVLRGLAVAAVTSTVLVTGTTAEAAPPAGKGSVKVHGPAAKGAKGGAKSAALLAKLVAQAGRALDRAVAPSRTGALTADSLAALQANVEADRALLATYTSRTELAGFRTVNYVHVVNVLREAEALLATLDPASAQSADLATLVGEALAVTATTPRSDVTALLDALEGASVTP